MVPNPLGEVVMMLNLLWKVTMDMAVAPNSSEAIRDVMIVMEAATEATAVLVITKAILATARRKPLWR